MSQVTPNDCFAESRTHAFVENPAHSRNLTQSIAEVGWDGTTATDRRVAYLQRFALCLKYIRGELFGNIDNTGYNGFEAWLGNYQIDADGTWKGWLKSHGLYVVTWPDSSVSSEEQWMQINPYDGSTVDSGDTRVGDWSIISAAATSTDMEVVQNDASAFIATCTRVFADGTRTVFTHTLTMRRSAADVIAEVWTIYQSLPAWGSGAVCKTKDATGAIVNPYVGDGSSGGGLPIQLGTSITGDPGAAPHAGFFAAQSPVWAYLLDPAICQDLFAFVGVRFKATAYFWHKKTWTWHPTQLLAPSDWRVNENFPFDHLVIPALKSCADGTIITLEPADSTERRCYVPFLGVGTPPTKIDQMATAIDQDNMPIDQS